VDQSEHDHAWREINHRVANSFQMLSAALMAQTREAASAEVKRALRSASDRVRYMSEVQRLLYDDAGEEPCDFGAFLAALGTALGQAYCAPGRRVQVASRGDIRLPRDAAAALGGVVAELVINACKHAWAEGRPGVVRVEAGVVQDRLQLSVADDGRGLDGGDLRAGGGLGGQILAGVARRLGADWAVSDARPGCRVDLTLPLDGRAPAPVDLCA
jgi:two-component sensor histidine kinase